MNCSVPSNKLNNIENIDPTQTSMKTGCWFWMMPSISLNDFKKALSGSLAVPGMTTTANPSTRPAVKEHNKVVTIRAASIKVKVILHHPSCDLMLALKQDSSFPGSNEKMSPY